MRNQGGCRISSRSASKWFSEAATIIVARVRDITGVELDLAWVSELVVKRVDQVSRVTGQSNEQVIGFMIRTGIHDIADSLASNVNSGIQTRRIAASEEPG